MLSVQPRAGQAGVSLIEVLIAMVVLAFGILTAVGLQLVSKRNNIDSGQLTIASHLAYDLLERMRANSSVAALQTYMASPTVGQNSISAEPSPNCKSASCTAVQLALHDLWEWEEALDGTAETVDGTNVGGLANPIACLSGPAGSGSGIYIVTIVWRGATVLPDNAAVACGAATGQYGDNNRFRRSLSVQAYIAV